MSIPLDILGVFLILLLVRKYRHGEPENKKKYFHPKISGEKNLYLFQFSFPKQGKTVRVFRARHPVYFKC